MAPAHPQISRPTPKPALVRTAMLGFFLLGGLMALLGALLPVWVHYVHFDLVTAGNYFLAFNLGIFGASVLSRGILGGLGLRRLLALACGLTSASLLALSMIFNPMALVFPLIVLGFAAGVLATGVSWLMFDAMTAPVAATTLSLAGAFFGMGAVGFILLIWAGVHNLTAPEILVLTAVLPLALGLVFARQRSLAQPALDAMPVRLPAGATHSPTAILLTLTLFFQSGSEWAAGGWLAVYWIRRLGVSQDTALFGLAVYWTALTLGKLLGPRAPWLSTPLRLVAASTLASVFGGLLLLATAGPGGAAVGSMLLGAGLGSVYPLILGMIGERFPYYHPGFFNGFFSFSLVGGMLAPWLVGYLADAWIIEWAVAVPALGAFVVAVLLLIVLLEARASRHMEVASSGS